MQNSICLFHNGNSRVIELYRNKFADLKFCGNLAHATDLSPTGCLWEICFADATLEILSIVVSRNIKILRHISTYQDDVMHRLPECEPFDYNSWLNYAVTNYLCTASEVISDLHISSELQNKTIIVTTGRTANTHLQEVYRQHNKYAFESSNLLDQDFFSSKDSVLLWRQDHWACLASTWIARCTDYSKSHQTNSKPNLVFEHPVDAISLDWVKTEWLNLCQMTLDQALLSKYVCQRPVTHTTTEYITKNFVSEQKPLPYQKTQLIPNYDEVKNWYLSSELAKNINILYYNTVKHLDPWDERENLK